MIEVIDETVPMPFGSMEATSDMAVSVSCAGMFWIIFKILEVFSVILISP